MITFVQNHHSGDIQAKEDIFTYVMPPVPPLFLREDELKQTVDRDSIEAFHKVLEAQDVLTLKDLLESGKINSRWVRDAWCFALVYRQHDAALCLQQVGVPSGLTEAALMGSTEKVRSLLRRKRFDAQEYADALFAAIHARRHNALPMVQALLSHQKHLAEVKRKFGMTPLMYAIVLQAHALIEPLMQVSENLDARDNLGRTVLFYASRLGQQQTVAKLLKEGANPNEIASDSQTPLMVAVRHNQYAVVRTLLEHQADVAARDQSSNTVLFYAVVYASVKVIRLLLKYGANPTSENSIGELPLDRIWLRSWHIDEAQGQYDFTTIQRLFSSDVARVSKH